MTHLQANDSKESINTLPDKNETLKKIRKHFSPEYEVPKYSYHKDKPLEYFQHFDNRHMDHAHANIFKSQGDRNTSIETRDPTDSQIKELL